MWSPQGRAPGSLGQLAALIVSALVPALAPAGATTPAGFGQALQQMLAQAPAWATASARLDAARAQRNAASAALYNPEISVEREQADVDTDAVGLALAIDWSGKRRARRRGATAEWQAALAAWRGTRQQLLLQWLDAWLDLGNADVQLQLGAQRLIRLQQFAERAERRFSVGDLGSVERDLAALAWQQARIQQTRLLGEQGRARAALAAISPVLPQLELPQQLPGPVDDNATADLARLPAVAEAAALDEAAQLQVRNAELQRRPDPTLSVRTGRVDVGLPQKENLFAVGVSIPLPLLNTHGAELAGARAEARAAGHRLADQQLQAGARLAQMRTHFNALRSSCSELGGDPGSDPARLALLDRLWQSGELSSADYLVQLDQTWQTQQERAALQGDVWRAWFDWLAASGQLDTWLELGTDTDPVAAVE